MKKIIAMLLAMAMLLCFAACQSTETENPGNKEPVQGHKNCPPRPGCGCDRGAGHTGFLFGRDQLRL